MNHEERVNLASNITSKFLTKYKEDIRRLTGGRVIIKDADGNRYEIKDYRKLDQKSASLIDSEI